MRHIDITNQKFGRLTVLYRLPPSGAEGVIWHCICDCGNHVDHFAKRLRGGKVKSCGCGRGGLGIDEGGKRRVAPNNAWKHPLYKTWANMLKRCDPERSLEPLYVKYGMCERWKSFDNWVADMGDKPGPEYSIDRIDNTKGYEPGNCRWATAVIQANNKSNNRLIEYDGRIQTMQQWASELHMSVQTLSNRLNTYGWSVERSLTESTERFGPKYRNHRPKVPPAPK